jgi:hypothetical protein
MSAVEKASKMVIPKNLSKPTLLFWDWYAEVGGPTNAGFARKAQQAMEDSWPEFQALGKPRAPKKKKTDDDEEAAPSKTRNNTNEKADEMDVSESTRGQDATPEQNQVPKDKVLVPKLQLRKISKHIRRIMRHLPPASREQLRSIQARLEKIAPPSGESPELDESPVMEDE